MLWVGRHNYIHGSPSFTAAPSQVARDVKVYDQMQSSTHPIALGIRPRSSYGPHPAIFSSVFAKAYNDYQHLDDVLIDTAELRYVVDPAAEAHDVVDPAAEAHDAVDPAAEAHDVVDPAAEAHDAVDPTAEAHDNQKAKPFDTLIWADDFSNVVCSPHTAEVSLCLALAVQLRVFLPRLTWLVEYTVRGPDGRATTQLDAKGQFKTAHGLLSIPIIVEVKLGDGAGGNGVVQMGSSFRIYIKDMKVCRATQSPIFAFI